MFTHDVIKMKYSQEGYLPDYPPHLISDEEMFDAFISGCSQDTYFHYDSDRDIITFDVDDWANYMSDDTPSVFKDNYPNISESNLLIYKTLIADIVYHIYHYLNDTDSYTIPPWVYSYMICEVISINSPKEDIHDILVMMLCDNIDDEFNETAASKCINISSQYRNTMNIDVDQHRPVTMFCEPFIVKHLRLRSLVR